jgi:GNAT superfamily N-acetyltransferase
MNIVKTDQQEIRELLLEHMRSLVYPMDSWLEDKVSACELYQLILEETLVGYAGSIKETIHFFYVKKEHYRYAAQILEQVIETLGVKRVFVMTQDPLVSALVAEWDYDKEKVGCWFIDSGKVDRRETLVDHAVFRPATAEDDQKIHEICGNFFDDSIGTIFVLEDQGDFLGAGIVEPSRFLPGLASIGMFANPEFRRKGVAKRILLSLKDWVYENGMIPSAGCWYYNTLSRWSLESAGMIATSIGFEAILKGKEKPPVRTGNPPGELVDW